MSASSSSSSMSTGFNPGQSPNYSFTRPRAPSPYMRSVLVYIDAVNARDFSSLETVFDEALEHRILPKSMARPVLTKRQYIEYWKRVMAMFCEFQTKIHEVIEAGEKVTLHGSTVGKSLSGTPYTNEYMVVMHFIPLTQAEDERGELPKIRYLKEFVDSSVSLNFFKEDSERRKAKKAASKAARATNGHRDGSTSPSGISRARAVRPTYINISGN